MIKSLTHRSDNTKTTKHEWYSFTRKKKEFTYEKFTKAVWLKMKSDK